MLLILLGTNKIFKLMEGLMCMGGEDCIGRDMKTYQFDEHCQHCSRPIVLYMNNGYRIISIGTINNLNLN